MSNLALATDPGNWRRSAIDERFYIGGARRVAVQGDGNYAKNEMDDGS